MSGRRGSAPANLRGQRAAQAVAGGLAYIRRWATKGSTSNENSATKVKITRSLSSRTNSNGLMKSDGNNEMDTDQEYDSANMINLKTPQTKPPIAVRPTPSRIRSLVSSKNDVRKSLQWASTKAQQATAEGLVAGLIGRVVRFQLKGGGSESYLGPRNVSGNTVTMSCEASASMFLVQKSPFGNSYIRLKSLFSGKFLRLIRTGESATYTVDCRGMEMESMKVDASFGDCESSLCSIDSLLTPISKTNATTPNSSKTARINGDKNELPLSPVSAAQAMYAEGLISKSDLTRLVGYADQFQGEFPTFIDSLRIVPCPDDGTVQLAVTNVRLRLGMISSVKSYTEKSVGVIRQVVPIPCAEDDVAHHGVIPIRFILCPDGGWDISSLYADSPPQSEDECCIGDNDDIYGNKKSSSPTENITCDSTIIEPKEDKTNDSITIESKFLMTPCRRENSSIPPNGVKEWQQAEADAKAVSINGANLVISRARAQSTDRNSAKNLNSIIVGAMQQNYRRELRGVMALSMVRLRRFLSSRVAARSALIVLANNTSNALVLKKESAQWEYGSACSDGPLPDSIPPKSVRWFHNRSHGILSGVQGSCVYRSATDQDVTIKLSWEVPWSRRNGNIFSVICSGESNKSSSLNSTGFQCDDVHASGNHVVVCFTLEHRKKKLSLNTSGTSLSSIDVNTEDAQKLPCVSPQPQPWPQISGFDKVPETDVASMIDNIVCPEDSLKLEASRSEEWEVVKGYESNSDIKCAQISTKFCLGVINDSLDKISSFQSIQRRSGYVASNLVDGASVFTDDNGSVIFDDIGPFSEWDYIVTESPCKNKEEVSWTEIAYRLTVGVDTDAVIVFTEELSNEEEDRIVSYPDESFCHSDDDSDDTVRRYWPEGLFWQPRAEYLFPNMSSEDFDENNDGNISESDELQMLPAPISGLSAGCFVSNGESNFYPVSSSIVEKREDQDKNTKRPSKRFLATMAYSAYLSAGSIVDLMGFGIPKNSNETKRKPYFVFLRERKKEMYRKTNDDSSSFMPLSEFRDAIELLNRAVDCRIKSSMKIADLNESKANIIELQRLISRQGWPASHREMQANLLQTMKDNVDVLHHQLKTTSRGRANTLSKEEALICEPQRLIRRYNRVRGDLDLTQEKLDQLNRALERNFFPREPPHWAGRPYEGSYADMLNTLAMGMHSSGANMAAAFRSAHLLPVVASRDQLMEANSKAAALFQENPLRLTLLNRIQATPINLTVASGPNGVAILRSHTTESLRFISGLPSLDVNLATQSWVVHIEVHSELSVPLTGIPQLERFFIARYLPNPDLGSNEKMKKSSISRESSFKRK